MLKWIDLYWKVCNTINNYVGSIKYHTWEETMKELYIYIDDAGVRYNPLLHIFIIHIIKCSRTKYYYSSYINAHTNSLRTLYQLFFKYYYTCIRISKWYIFIVFINIWKTYGKCGHYRPINFKLMRPHHIWMLVLKSNVTSPHNIQKFWCDLECDTPLANPLAYALEYPPDNIFKHWGIENCKYIFKKSKLINVNILFILPV
jgi:hypothetical protein